MVRAGPVMRVLTVKQRSSDCIVSLHGLSSWYMINAWRVSLGWHEGELFLNKTYLHSKIENYARHQITSDWNKSIKTSAVALSRKPESGS